MVAKSIFDWVVSAVALLIISPFLLIIWIICAIDTGSDGFFLQERIGRHGKVFNILKLRTMHYRDHGISATGRTIRRFKLDELPQLLNILKGDMAIVGPRPDVPGYYDRLTGEDRKILNLKPGLTSPAAIKYHREEQILASQDNPEKYNDEIIFPDKVAMNREYYEKHTFAMDIAIIFRTFKRLTSSR